MCIDPHVAESRAEVLACYGSRYGPSSPLSAIGDVLDDPRIDRLHRQVGVDIGPGCAGFQAHGAGGAGNHAQ